MLARVILLARFLFIAYSLIETNLTLTEFNIFFPSSFDLVFLKNFTSQLFTCAVAVAAPLKQHNKFYAFR